MSNKVSNAASTQATLQEAKLAASDLAQQRANAAARKADPLWYRIEDVVPAVLAAESDFPTITTTKHTASRKSFSAAASASSIVPTIHEQLQILERALAHNGMTRSDVTPQAMACLLEYARRYTTDLVRDATDYADMVHRSELTRADLMLASELRQDNPTAISTQLPMLNSLSQQLNRRPLPPIPANCYSGILLPAPEHQLTGRTFDVISGAVTSIRAWNKYPSAQNPSSSTAAAATTAAATTGKSSESATKAHQPSYGAARGRQISVKLKDDTVTEMSATGAAAAAATATSNTN